MYLNSPNLFSQTTHAVGDWEACYILFVKNQSVEYKKLRQEGQQRRWKGWKQGPILQLIQLGHLRNSIVVMRMRMLWWIHPACTFLWLLRKLNSWFLSWESWECPINLFQLVRTALHMFPPQSQGPECSWIQEMSRIGMRRGKFFYFFESLFGHWFGHLKSKICFIETNSFL